MLGLGLGIITWSLKCHKRVKLLVTKRAQAQSKCQKRTKTAPHEMVSIEKYRVRTTFIFGQHSSSHGAPNLDIPVACANPSAGSSAAVLTPIHANIFRVVLYPPSYTPSRVSINSGNSTVRHCCRSNLFSQYVRTNLDVWAGDVSLAISMIFFFLLRVLRALHIFCTCFVSKQQQHQQPHLRACPSAPASHHLCVRVSCFVLS